MLTWRFRAWGTLVLAIGALACGDSGVDDLAGGGTGGSGASGGEGGTGGTEPEPTETILHPDQPPLPGETECVVTIREHLVREGQQHVDVCTPVAYETNPPSSGDHWPIWAQYRVFDTPVPRQMLVHNLEHGSILMLHDCEEACPDVTAAFEQAAVELGPDPLCVASPANAERSRIVFAPDPELDEPIGLAAWRATYTATCIDPPSLLDFLEKHYATGPEQVCSQGKDPADPATGVPACSQ
jgi:hypothetical protein